MESDVDRGTKGTFRQTVHPSGNPYNRRKKGKRPRIGKGAMARTGEESVVLFEKSFTSYVICCKLWEGRKDCAKGGRILRPCAKKRVGRKRYEVILFSSWEKSPYNVGARRFRSMESTTGGEQGRIGSLQLRFSTPQQGCQGPKRTKEQTPHKTTKEKAPKSNRVGGNKEKFL